jgi:hypothetical protein
MDCIEWALKKIPEPPQPPPPVTVLAPPPGTPGQKAPFDMLVTEGSMPLHLVACYTLSVDY